MHDAAESGLPVSDKTRMHVQRIAAVLKNPTPDERAFLGDCEIDIWLCIGGYWYAKTRSGAFLAKEQTADLVSANAIAVMASIFFQAIANGAHVRLLRPSRKRKKKKNERKR